jgi:hypothetical protein
VVDLASDKDETSKETIASTHHDAPRYILSGETPGRNIRSAPFINHTDLELQIIEELVGRELPYSLAGGGYNAPRKDNY